MQGYDANLRSAHPEPMKKVAVLGTGKMGGAIARRLHAAGFDISVWDRTKSKAESLQVGRVVDSPADAARGADVLITMVTGPQALRDVYFGPSGVFAAGTDSTIVDMSTVGPAAARELADAAELHEPAMFAVRDILKDLDLGLALYQRAPGARSKVPLTAITRDLFAAVASRAPDLDISAIVTAYSADRLPRQSVEERPS